MSIFPTPNAERLWLHYWCESCWRTQEHGPGCAIRDELLSGRLPTQLVPSSRRAPGARKLYRCIEHAKRPPVLHTPRAKATGVQGRLFDPDPQKRRLVQVPGWPDRP